jgi:hypothetical protein
MTEQRSGVSEVCGVIRLVSEHKLRHYDTFESEYYADILPTLPGGPRPPQPPLPSSQEQLPPSSGLSRWDHDPIIVKTIRLAIMIVFDRRMSVPDWWTVSVLCFTSLVPITG